MVLAIEETNGVHLQTTLLNIHEQMLTSVATLMEETFPSDRPVRLLADVLGWEALQEVCDDFELPV